MWERLRQSDIAQAKRDLRLRADEILRRHASELRSIEVEVAEVATLYRLVDAFSSKFPRETASAAEPVPEPEPATAEPAAAPAPAAAREPAAGRASAASASANGNAAAERKSSNVRQLDPDQGPRDRARTNFDAFTRAVSKNERGW